MNKFLLFVIAFQLLSCSDNNSDYINNYYPHMHKGIIAFEKGSIDSAFFYLDKAFSKCSPRNTIPHYEIDVMAKVTAKLEKHNICSEMIKKQLKNGFTITKYSGDTLYSEFFNSEVGIKLLENADDFQKSYQSNVDSTLFNKLKLMLSEDQKNRGSEEQQVFDKRNEKRLIELFEKGIYPDESIRRLCNPYEADIHTVLLHTDDSIRINYFLPKLLQFVKMGKCDPKVYANVYDQYFLYNGDPQIYGTYRDTDKNLSNHIDMEKLNSNRLSIGLMTLDQKQILHELKIKNYPSTYGRFYN